MTAADHLVQPHLTLIQSPGKTMLHNLSAIGCFPDDGIGLHHRAAVLSRAEVNRQGYGQIFTPPSLVIGVTLPGRSLILGAMDLKKRDRVGRIIALVEPV